MIPLAILDDYLRNALTCADWTVLQKDVAITTFEDHIDDRDEERLAERLAPFAIVCGMRERTWFRRPLLARLPALRLLCSTSPRNAAIDLLAARDLGITVCGTNPPRPIDQTAELTWGLIHALIRNIPGEDRLIRQGGWQERIGRDLHGATLGLVGWGGIGKVVGRVGLAFSMKVLAWSPNLTPERIATPGVELVSKEDLFRRSDIVSVHMVLSERTRGLIGAPEFGLMKRSAVIVNTSRGPLIEEAALIAALQAGRIAGAGLDTFDVEPLPSEHVLRRLPNTVLTGHIGYVTENAYRIFYGETVENVQAYLAGKPKRVMNPAAATDRSAPWFLE
ncbi:MAG: D-2-hydroxyacid dehydrogenase family protein [Alphaproteobacteria bacterium]|nr:D-2-hydroxyacid dehydrogenase family protein [Alphaproteobacteria bacterium]